MAKRSDLTHARLREVLYYDPDLGWSMWLVPRPGQFAGAGAGSMACGGYVRIRIDGVAYQAHRLAWLYMTGAWPEHEIDHRFGLSDDNRFHELRDLSHADNLQNRRGPTTKNAIGVLGVSWDARTNNWRAQIKKLGRVVFSKNYDTVEQARSARLDAKRRFHSHGVA